MSLIVNLENLFEQFNQTVYKYLVFLYYKDGWARRLLCSGYGALTALAMPPFYGFFLLPIGFSSIIRLTDFCKTYKATFSTGFWFNFGFHLVVLYWVPLSTLHDKVTIWFFIPGLIAIPAVLSAVGAIAFMLYYFISSYNYAVGKVIIFGLIWTAFEYIKASTLAFPWSYIGYSWSAYENLSQSASIFGVLGISLLLATWASSWHLVFLTGDKTEFARYVMVIVFLSMAIVVCWIFGLTRTFFPAKTISDNKFTALVVQGNSEVGAVAKPHLQLAKHILLTKKHLSPDVDMVIWPEGSTRFFIYNEDFLRKKIGSMLSRHQYISIGGLRYSKPGGLHAIALSSSKMIPSDLPVHNSITFIGSQGIGATYDKTHLVPFGEYIPLRSSLPEIHTHIKAFANFQKSIPGDITPGTGPKMVKLSQNIPPFVPLICYEIAFSGQVMPKKSSDARWILNSTNDKWFFYTSGAVQHYRIAQMRAIEEGAPVIRAANSGISAMFDPYGRVMQKIPFGVTKAEKFEMPDFQRVPTLFSLIGNLPIVIFLATIILFKFADALYVKLDRNVNSQFSIAYSAYITLNKNLNKKELSKEHETRKKKKDEQKKGGK